MEALSEFCNKNGIIYIGLPPNSIHITQPMDIRILSPIMNIWRQKRIEWNENNPGTRFTYFDFVVLLKETLNLLKENTSTFEHPFRAFGKQLYSTETNL